jgi:hypothetical protein
MGNEILLILYKILVVFYYNIERENINYILLMYNTIICITFLSNSIVEN